MKGMTKKNFIVSVALGLALPSIALAAGISVSDVVAGIGAQAVVSGVGAGGHASITLSAPDGKVTRYDAKADPDGTARTWFPGNTLTKAGTYSADAMLDGGAGTHASFIVEPDTVDEHTSSVMARSGTISRGEQSVVSVVLRDRFGNPLPGHSARLLSSKPSDVIEAISKETDENGEQRFRLTAQEAGDRSLRAIDLITGTVVAQMANAAVEGLGGNDAAYAYPAPASQTFYPSANHLGAVLVGDNMQAQTAGFQQLDHFKITIHNQEQNQNPQLKLNEADSMSVTAIDQNGNPFFNYQGTVYLFSTDPLAELPKDGVLQFGFADQGKKQFTLGLTFRTLGMQTLAISPSPDNVGTVLGSINVNVVGQIYTQPTRSIAITEPKPGTVITTKTITVSGTGPAFINIVVSGGTEQATGETDMTGRFSVPVTIDGTKSQVTLSVKDPDGHYESDPRSFVVDMMPPTISAIDFTPDNPEENTDVLVVVKTETGVSAVTMDVNGDVKTLSSTDATSGKYQLLFAAPVAGIYAPKISVTDKHGNIATKNATLSVDHKALPKVMNVIADGQINAVGLRWDPVTSETIDAYRIYVGVQPEVAGDPVQFLYTLDTDRPVAAATVAGLKPGTLYFLAVTALKAGQESKEKSDFAKAVVLGVQINVTPQDGALFLEWNSLQNNIPLSSFILEYGAEADKYTENRTLNGELRAYTVGDLINGVTYYLKLTPVTTTGEKLTDLAATGQGTPTGKGFTMSPSDPAPNSLHASAGTPPAPTTPNPPSNTGSGVPTQALFAAVLVSMLIFGLWLRHRRHAQTAVAFLHTMEGRYRQSR